MAAGEHVVDVPSTLSARVRVLDSTRSQKNDANDARSVAIVALRNPGLRVVTPEDHVAVLRMLAKRHKQLGLASLKTQAAARLHAVLAQLIPGGLGKEMVVRQAPLPSLVLGSPVACPDSAARAAATASTGSDLP